MNDLIKHIKKTGRDFTKQALDESQVHISPIQQFNNWFKSAIEARIINPGAMIVATATKGGKPYTSVLLLRNYDDEGFVFTFSKAYCS